MRVEAAEAAGRRDALFVAPHVHDVPLACARRLKSEVQQGRRVLLAVAFGGVETGSGWPELLAEWGIDWLALNLPAAVERDPAYAALGAVAFGRRDGDENTCAELTGRLEALVRVTRPGDVYLPMAVGGHIDHRLAHEAGLLAARRMEAANVFLYEERPPAYLPGAVRLRLAHMGARLPPAAQLPPASSLALAWLRFQGAPFVSCAPAGRLERLRASGPLLRAWRAGRLWRPLRALGLRLQPVIHAGTAETEEVRRALECWLGQPEGRGWSPARLRSLAQRFERTIDRRSGAERYWLVLPERGEA